MGGYGSGCWDRWHKQDYLDDHIHLDVQRWKREGFLNPGNRFGWQWSFGSDTPSTIQVHVGQERVVLQYLQRLNGGEWCTVEESISLVYTACHFGGQRVWFSCPGCDRRAAKLYHQDSSFCCRKCCNLPYACQSEYPAYRALRKARKLREKLGASSCLLEPVGEKPKGMHWQTFHRLCKQSATADLKSLNYIPGEDFGPFDEP